MKSKPVKIVGLMSGTSLDGLDIALCEFDSGIPNFKLLAAETIPYNAAWKERLQGVYKATAEQYFALNSQYGAFIAESVKQFLAKHKQQAHYIASHGHTVFHNPASGFTTQIGCGATIAAHTSITTICDFRSLDVALKGQGAPLVPIGDRDLFHQYESCLNIGGIANISFTQTNTTEAFDICVANMALNYLTETIGKAYDEHGALAAKGKVSPELLHQLSKLNTNDDSLGREWFEQYFLPVLTASAISLEDKLASCVEYIALKISHCLTEYELQSVLITGGGAYNTFLINRLKHHYKGKVEIPADEIIQFKEAIIFAYLGYLRMNEEVSTLSSVTGAERNSVGGCVYLGNVAR